jgi:hypothetical protein
MKKLILVLFACIAGFALHAQTADTTIVFTEVVHNFGEILQNAGPQTHSFEFTNTGTEPILIQRVQASCGCTTPGWTKEPVAPGEKGFVQATYNPSSPQTFNKSLTVTTNANPGSIILRIQGKVVAPPAPPAEETTPPTE